MLRKIHPVAGIVGFLTILIFWTATVAVEAFGGPAAILTVKTGILWGMIVLIPALATAGATGFRLVGRNATGLAATKLRRMPVIAGNGIVVLIPCAFYLQRLAASGDFGSTFYAVQAIELLAGAVNLAMMGLNIRDGLRLTKRRRRAGSGANPRRSNIPKDPVATGG